MHPIQLNIDFMKRCVVNTNALDWQPSRTQGIERRMVERDGAEVARASSVVRYAPGSEFPRDRKSVV